MIFSRRLFSSPLWPFLYLSFLIFILSLLDRVLFHLPVEWKILVLLYLCNIFLFSLVFFSRRLAILFSTLLVSLLIGYVAIKALHFIPPVDDTLALMFLAQSDWDEIHGFLSWQILVAIFVAIFVSYLVVYPAIRQKNHFWKISRKKRLLLSFFSLFFLVFLYPFVINELPYNLFQISWSFSNTKDYSTSLRDNSKTPALIVYFIGESLRADHLSINGYSRNTTPLLEHLPIVNFGMAYSCATYTKASWLYLNKRARCSEVVPDQDNLTTIFKHFGYKTYYVALMDIATEKQIFHDSDVSKNIGRSVYRLDIPFSKLSLAPRSFVILGHRGSHYNYKTYPLLNPQFTPVCNANTFIDMKKHCSVQEIVNDYDNTILQLDLSIQRIIKELSKKQEPALFLYTSDHGEMLGEHGIWAHGFTPRLNKTHLVPLFFWVNEAYKREWPQKYRMLVHNSYKYRNQVQHDDLWYSILDGVGITDIPPHKILNLQRSLFSSNYSSKRSKTWYLTEYP